MVLSSLTLISFRWCHKRRYSSISVSLIMLSILSDSLNLTMKEIVLRGSESCGPNSSLSGSRKESPFLSVD